MDTANVPSTECLALRIGTTLEKALSATHRLSSSSAAPVAIPGVIVCLTLLVYAGFQRLTLGTLGFPLDDSWIYQQFARNLAQYGTFTYNPGVPASGATSVLWVPVLALAYALGVDPIIWTYACGAIALFGLALASYWTSLAVFPGRRGVALVTAVVVAADWRMTWSALSGMETAIFTALSVVMLGVAVKRLNPLLIGVIGGLLAIARPEGLLLLTIASAISLASLDGIPLTRRFLHAIGVIAGSGAVLAPYFALNWSLTGTWMPTTFYAKQALYAAVTSSGRVAYLIEAARMILIGPAANAIFAVGAVVAAHKILASRNLLRCLPLVWVAVLLVVYALRLPVSFQHGRYFMPLIPVAIIYSVAGTSDLLTLARLHSYRMLQLAFPVLAAALVIISWAIGARILATDVGIIESEHVETARWIDAHTPPGSVVATHDIGALAYFSGRRIIDTTGLLAPDFIAVVRDDKRTLALAQEKGADYFAFLPDWYPRLEPELRGEKVFEASGDYLRRFGRRSMVVYRLDYRGSPDNLATIR